MPKDPTAAYRNTLATLLEGINDNAPCRESVRGTAHDWVVFTTYVEDVALGLFCRRCGCDGVVQYPRRADWVRASDAPSKPYRWRNGRAVRFINRRLHVWRQELEWLDHH